MEHGVAAAQAEVEQERVEHGAGEEFRAGGQPLIDHNAGPAERQVRMGIAPRAKLHGNPVVLPGKDDVAGNGVQIGRFRYVQRPGNDLYSERRPIHRRHAGKQRQGIVNGRQDRLAVAGQFHRAAEDDKRPRPQRPVITPSPKILQPGRMGLILAARFGHVAASAATVAPAFKCGRSHRP